MVTLPKSQGEAAIGDRLSGNGSFLRQQYLESAKGFVRLLSDAVATAGEWIEGLVDPEAGDVGRSFSEAYAHTGCEQDLDPDFFTRACFNSHSIKLSDSGFHNNILYGSLAMKKLDVLFSARVHESTHAMQNKNTPALHASPFNPKTKIIICPEDWLFLQERCEQGAYAMQAWFSTLLADEAEDGGPDLAKKIIEGSEREPVAINQFRRLRQEAGSLAGALVGAARESLTKNFYSDSGQYDYYKFADNYADSALTGYTQVMNVRRNERNETGFKFVRLSDKDREAAVRAIGSSFGPNCFGEPEILPEFLKGAILSDKINSKVATQSPIDRLGDLNKSLGIGNYGDLPTLSDELAKIGKTPENFLAEQYAAVVHVKPRPDLSLS
jgi:hypothetical protein